MIDNLTISNWRTKCRCLRSIAGDNGEWSLCLGVLRWLGFEVNDQLLRWTSATATCTSAMRPPARCRSLRRAVRSSAQCTLNGMSSHDVTFGFRYALGGFGGGGHGSGYGYELLSSTSFLNTRFLSSRWFDLDQRLFFAPFFALRLKGSGSGLVANLCRAGRRKQWAFDAVLWTSAIDGAFLRYWALSGPRWDTLSPTRGAFYLEG
jgi:hypothetical protein